MRLLLAAIADAGGSIYHHGDFDDTGLLILRDLQARYGAEPWRFDLQSLEAALMASGKAASPRDAPTLEMAVATMKSSVPEELILDTLIGDLRSSSEGVTDDRAAPLP